MDPVKYSSDSKITHLANINPTEHPNKASHLTRLQTFENWPKPEIDPKILATAGFFYVGFDDFTTCFQCGVTLGEWETNEDPWKAHALWSSKCLHLQLHKGPNYIKTVVDKLLGCESEKMKMDVTERLLCKICYNKQLELIFLPCKHIVACLDCALNLKTCPICSKYVAALIKIYFSDDSNYKNMTSTVESAVRCQDHKVIEVLKRRTI